MGEMISLIRIVKRTMAMRKGPIDSASEFPLRTPRKVLRTAWIGTPISVHQSSQIGCQRSPIVSHGSWRGATQARRGHIAAVPRPPPGRGGVYAFAVTPQDPPRHQPSPARL